MKKLYILLGLIFLCGEIGAFTYMGNNTLVVTNSSGFKTTLSFNESMDMDNSTYHLRLEAPSQDIDPDMVITFLTKFMYEVVLGVVIVIAVFYFMYRLGTAQLR